MILHARADANSKPELLLVPSLVISDTIAVSQRFYTVSLFDKDAIRPIFRISNVFVVVSSLVTEANSFWRGSFYINPVTGELTTFGRLNGLDVPQFILTIQADDSAWQPEQYDFKNLTVIISNGCVP